MLTRRLLPLVFLFLTLAPLLHSQTAGGVTPAEPRFRVIRSVSGSRGSVQAGRYVVEDPRTIFYLPADREVIVYFEWEGPIGPHQFEGYWKNPEGKTVVISDFRYEAKQRRFGGYWTLALTDTTAPGIWSLEARVDGEVTGTHNFQIIAAEKPATSEPTRRILEPAEIYKRAVGSTVFIDALDEKGERFHTTSGFFVEAGVLLATFQGINGAATLRLTLPDGHRSEAREVLAWNRLQDWVLLRVDGARNPKLPRAAAASWSVGDRCYSLDTPVEGNRTIVDENVTGLASFPYAGKRLSLSHFPMPEAIGSPVLNEYGEVIGIFGGTIYPGMPSRQRVMDVAVATLMQGPLATPIDLIPEPSTSAPSRSLSDLRAAGEFIPRVAPHPELVSAYLMTGPPPKKNDLLLGGPTKVEFSRRDSASLLMAWNPRAKGKAVVSLKVFDAVGRPVLVGPPAQLKFRAGQFMQASWNLEVGRLGAGLYRLDMLEGETPVWRTYFRVTD